jgi:hypothetical protein
VAASVEYAEEMARRLKERDWPWFENGDFLAVLEGFAMDANKRKTLDGHLAALLIYHQLVEEMTRVLVESARFFVQLRLYPAEIHFKTPKKPMMGYWIEELESAIDFDGKTEFVQTVRELNGLRNSVFHGISKHTSADDLIKKLAPTWKLYRRIIKQFSSSHDWFALTFKDIAKDDDWWQMYKLETYGHDE